MTRTVAPALLVSIVLALAGCDGDSAPAATSTPTSTATPSVTATSTPSSSPTPTAAATATATVVPSATSAPTPSASPTASATETLTPTPTPTAIDDELPAELDNGTEGRNPFADPNHLRPVEACADELVATDRSLVIRVLPRGPLAPDGSLAFTSGVCVYLPPGYLQSGLRYPVLYLLHGGGSDQAAWVTFGRVQSIMDGFIAADPSSAAIAVMPDGNDAQWYDSLDGTIANERYVLDFLIPYVDRHFRTIAERGGRAIDGLSNGGYGAMHLAAKAPDRFVAAGGMSSNLAALSFPGLGDATSPAYRHGNLPADLAGNLNGLDLTSDIGTECVTDRQIDNCLTWTFEQLFVPANREFVASVQAVRGPGDGVYEYRESEGAHAWRWWMPWLRDRHLPFLLARLADPRTAGEPPLPPTPRAGFRYRSMAADFSAWGYEVHVERAVREFVDLTDVRAGGLVVQGSGTVTIRAAPLYEPGRAYLVSGAGGPDQRIVADAGGRITFSVDLGPAHEHEQYSPEADALEAAGGYWTIRTVIIAEA
jgi:S-formylglutathione hydrolase FrmB